MERHYFGLSTLLASVALLIWSIGETFAYPQGPNVSMGSNPIEVYQVSCYSATRTLLNTTNQKFIITDLIVSGGSYNYGVQFHLNGSSWLYFSINENFHFQSGIPVPPNSVLECDTAGSSRTVTISGYFAH